MPCRPSRLLSDIQEQMCWHPWPKECLQFFRHCVFLHWMPPRVPSWCLHAPVPVFFNHADLTEDDATDMMPATIFCAFLPGTGTAVPNFVSHSVLTKHFTIDIVRPAELARNAFRYKVHQLFPCLVTVFVLLGNVEPRRQIVFGNTLAFENGCETIDQKRLERHHKLCVLYGNQFIHEHHHVSEIELGAPERLQHSNNLLKSRKVDVRHLVILDAHSALAKRCKKFLHLLLSWCTLCMCKEKCKVNRIVPGFHFNTIHTCVVRSIEFLFHKPFERMHGRRIIIGLHVNDVAGHILLVWCCFQRRLTMIKRYVRRRHEQGSLEAKRLN
mmetsp:Transcript_45987/g.67466  ORF Transcript_45987/g.67466 Transcript_45987/m.67466 type:complete len:327 (+) Transcript_45987:451-1431(+)